MSLLNKIKDLFFKGSNEAPAVDQNDKETTTKSEVKSEPVIESKPAPVTSSALEKDKEIGLQIPQDATLKRHFISALKNKIEDSMPCRPTDSTLKRHYDAAVQAELDKLLS